MTPVFCLWLARVFFVLVSRRHFSLGLLFMAVHLACCLWLRAGCSLGSMCVSDSAKVYITCANSLIFADLAELLDLAQFTDA